MPESPARLIDRVTEEIGQAAKARDSTRLGALRLLKAALLNREIEKKQALDDRDALQVVASLIKQRRDSIEQFEAAGRLELADKERAEREILEAFQPPPVDPAELAATIERAVVETGAASPRDMGKVMKHVLAALEGRTVDGRAVSEQVRQRLSS